MKSTFKELEDYVKETNVALENAGYLPTLVLGFDQRPNLKQRAVFYRISETGCIGNQTSRTQLTKELTFDEAMSWLKLFYPPAYGFLKADHRNLYFPNGFDSWHETHYEITITMNPMEEGTLSFIAHEQNGTGGLYDLAKVMTDKFENENSGRIWDGNFFDVIQSFCQLNNL